MGLLVALALAAQPPFALTRQQALARVAQSPQLLASARGVDIANAGVRSAGAWPNPSIGVSYGSDDPQLFGTLDQRFPIFGQRGSSIAAANGDVAVAKAELATRALELRVVADRAYTALAAAQQKLELTQQAAQLAKELADKTAAKVDARLAPELDLEQARLAAARAEQDVIDRRADLTAASAQLAAALGLPSDSALRATDALYPVPSPPPTAQLHPELRVAEQQKQAAQLRAERERAAVRPVPELDFEIQDHPTPEQSLGFRGGLTLEVPLFSQNGGNIDAQLAQAQQAEENREAATLRLSAEQRAAQAHWEAARSRAEFTVNHDVPASAHVRDLAQAAYELGRIPFTTFLQAEADMNRARSEAVDATAAAWDARADLAAASGAGP